MKKWICLALALVLIFSIPMTTQAAKAVIGDFDGDGTVNNEDVAYLLWHTLFPEDYPISTEADFTGDGKVNNEDVAYLLWHTLFPEDYPLGESANIWEQASGGFYFSSGAGAWATGLHVETDGSFTGSYSDADMGDGGPGYPYGTYYLCDFSGKFSKPRKIGPYMYTMTLEYITLEETPGKVVYEDGMKLVYTEPYGLEDGEEFILYLPGMPVSELDEEILYWFHLYGDVDTLPMYGIHNVNTGDAFASEW